MSYRPSADNVVRLVDELLRLSWIRDPETDPERRLYLDPSSASAGVKSLDPDAPYSLWFAGGVSPSVSQQHPTMTAWRDDDTVFRPAYCDDVKIVCGTRLATPAGDGWVMPCPNCGVDLHDQLSEAVVQLWGRDDVPADLKFIDKQFLCPAPDRCAACNVQVDITRIVVRADVLEEAPFSLFMINFQALRTPPMGVAQMPPELMEALSRLLGVGFRSVGRYG
jgi:hypothetical protein